MRVLALMAALILPACTGPLSALDPHGPAAASIATLWWGMRAGATGLFALVIVLFVLVMLRPDWGRQLPAIRWIVLGGLALPAVVLIPLTGYALFAGQRLLPLGAENPARIEAEGRQWVWSFRYPDHGGAVTEGTLHLPAGQPVDMIVTARDVIHGFWVPRLAGKIDAIPGHVTTLRLQADAPGTHEGLCAEFCGLDHAGMRFDVIVHPPEDFAAALAAAATASEATQ